MLLSEDFQKEAPERLKDSVTYEVHREGQEPEVSIKAARSNIWSVYPEFSLVMEESGRLLNFHREHDILFPFGVSPQDLFRQFEKVMSIDDSALILTSMKRHQLSLISKREHLSSKLKQNNQLTTEATTTLTEITTHTTTTSTTTTNSTTTDNISNNHSNSSKCSLIPSQSLNEYDLVKDPIKMDLGTKDRGKDTGVMSPEGLMTSVFEEKSKRIGSEEGYPEGVINPVDDSDKDGGPVAGSPVLLPDPDQSGLSQRIGSKEGLPVEDSDKNMVPVAGLPVLLSDPDKLTFTGSTPLALDAATGGRVESADPQRSLVPDVAPEAPVVPQVPLTLDAVVTRLGEYVAVAPGLHADLRETRALSLRAQASREALRSAQEAMTSSF